MIEVRDASGFTGYADQQFAPRSVAEVVDVLREATASKIPVTVAGSWTGVAGGAVPDGGWLLSMENLKSIEVGHGIVKVAAGVPARRFSSAGALLAVASSRAGIRVRRVEALRRLQ